MEAVTIAWRHRFWGPIIKVVGGYIVLVEIVLMGLFGRIDIPFIDVSWLEVGRRSAPIPRSIVLLGIVFGSLYAMVAMGLILVYRANRIINFAQAELGAVPAVVALLLVAKRGMPYLLAVPIALLGAALLGGLTEMTLIRRFNKSPRLILTVVTIGVSFMLLVLEFYSKKAVGGNLLDITTLSFPTPFQHVSFRIGPTTFSGDHIMPLIVVSVFCVGLAAFFRYTDIGIAVRASAENSERASLLGIPTKRVATIVWMLAATLSSACIFLRVPLTGLPLDGFVGLQVIILGLAAAAIARFESLPTALFAGIFVGIIEQVVYFGTRRAAAPSAVMLVVIILALLAQRGQLSRAADLGASTWQSVKDFRGIPTELRSLPEVRRTMSIIGFVILALVLTAPFLLGVDEAPAATLMVIYAIIGVSLVVLTGWAGQISLGQYAVAGVGAAVAGGLAANQQWDFFAAVFVGGLAGAAVAVLVGLPALRIQGLFLAVTTLAFAFFVESMLNREFFGWLLPKQGKLINRPNLWNRFNLESESDIGGVHVTSNAKYYYLCLAILLLVLAMARSLRKNRTGRLLIGVRDNGRLMQAYGVNLTRTRLAAFAIAGFMAGLAGGLLAFQNRFIADNAFTPDKSIQIFVMTVIGGIGSLPGAMLGAVFVLGLPLFPFLRDIDQIELLTSGLGLLVILLFLPGGLAEGVYRVRDNWLRRIAARRGIYVPSLVADSLEAQEAERAASEHIIEEAELTIEAVEEIAPLEPAR
jgi:branched-chain amino acid transport system permease protein